MPRDSINFNKSEISNSTYNKARARIRHCPDCNSNKLTFDSQRGEIVCGNCGLVVEDSWIDRGPEWRAYNKEQHDNRVRTGSPKNLLQYDPYGTVIDYNNRDIFGRNISPKKASQMFRLRTLQRRAVFQFGTERNLRIALNEIKRISSQLNIAQKIRETAAIVYRKILKTGLIRGRSTEALVAASVYLSCRLNKNPATLKDIAEKTRLSKKKVARNYRLLLKNLDFKIPLANPEGKIVKFGSMLNLPQIVINEAKEIFRKAKAAKITAGKNPNSLAASTLYIAALNNGIKCSQKEMAKVCQITEVTLRNRYKEQVEVLDIKLHL